MSKHEFQTEVTQLLDLMIHSLYSNKEIFLRELISNASDALDKLNYLCISDDNFKNLNYDPKIEIVADKEAKTLTISDSGIGMSKEDLVKNLGTIAKSGTKSFVENLSGDAKKDSSLIGQFGVGFYAAFMVASKVEVLTKKAGESQAHTWMSEAGAQYDISESDKEGHGTTITLYLKEDEVEFLEFFRIQSIVEKYSNHIPFPIFMEKVEEKEEGKTEVSNEQINKASALWRLNKSEIKEDEYKDFYKSISHDSEDPILYSHTKAEGTIEYNTLFYIPKSAPMDLFRVDYQSGIKLYVKRVFITDDDKELLPTYLRFVRGVIDVEDLPLNVSREILQQNVILSKVKKASVKKILSELKKLKNKDFETYKSFYSVFGRVLKEGIMGEFDNRDLLLDLLLFKSSKNDELIDLEQYKAQMPEDQKEIYYIIGENAQMLKNSPLIEGFSEKGIEVLLLDDEVDTIVIPNIGQYKEIPMTAANSAKLESDETDTKALSEQYAEVLVKLKEDLKDDVKDVKISTRLKKSPTCLVYDKDDPDFAMQQMLKQMGQSDLPPIKPILEINAEHEIFTKILEKKDFVALSNLAPVLLDLAKLSEGMKIEDSTGFADRVNKLIVGSL
ncbi:MAG: molecular chaperone HtpG [Epsilonproteobacteria bacterium]|nr:molecular chaperone HtpG [Campylobacterota bacterium]